MFFQDCLDSECVCVCGVACFDTYTRPLKTTQPGNKLKDFPIVWKSARNKQQQTRHFSTFFFLFWFVLFFLFFLNFVGIKIIKIKGGSDKDYFLKENQTVDGLTDRLTLVVQVALGVCDDGTLRQICFCLFWSFVCFSRKTEKEKKEKEKMKVVQNETNLINTYRHYDQKMNRCTRDLSIKTTDRARINRQSREEHNMLLLFFFWLLLHKLM